jgi:hypothetical protein
VLLQLSRLLFRLRPAICSSHLLTLYRSHLLTLFAHLTLHTSAPLHTSNHPTPPPNTTTQHHHPTPPPNNTTQQHHPTTPPNNTTQQHHPTTPPNNTTQQHHPTTPPNNTNTTTYQNFCIPQLTHRRGGLHCVVAHRLPARRRCQGPCRRP